jgi:predicted dithiol-disulfide oxidoreductase (DUF899 family)
MNQVSPRIVEQAEWLRTRKVLFEKERAMTHQLDILRAERRQLPWVKVDKPYVFQAPNGACSLADLFGKASQLAIYHYMLTPGSTHVCPGCSLLMDHVDAARQHFAHADLAFAAVSRAPIRQIEAVRRRMGWTFPWVSSGTGDFNYDLGVSFRDDERVAGRAAYNHGLTTIRNSPDMFGVSVFARDAAGGIFHTYSTYHRGVELLVGAFNWLDLVPKGRNEAAGTMSWVRLHDEYATTRD